MKKKILFAVFLLCSIFRIVAVGKQDSEMFSLTKNELSDGWEVRPDFGIKYRRQHFFTENKTKIAFRENILGVTDERAVIYKRLDCVFFPDYLFDDFSQFITKTKPSGTESAKIFEKMVKDKAPILYSITVVRKKRFRKKYVENLTKMKFNYVLGSDKTYVHIFSTTDVNMSQFTEQEKSIFYNIVHQVKELQSTIKVCSPGTITEALDKMKTFKFQAVDLYGNIVKDAYFKKARVTMVFYWDASEPLCRIRLKQILKMKKKHPSYRVNQLGIVANVTNGDHSNLQQTKKFLDDIDCRFINLKNNTYFSKFTRYLLQPSLLFFVDEDGKILTPIITKHLTDKQLEQVIKIALKQTVKK